MLKERKEQEIGDNPNKTGDTTFASQRVTNAKRKKSAAERIGIKGKR